MANERYFRVDVTEGGRTSPAYFYETAGGLADLQYGWMKYSSGMSESVTDAVRDFRETLQSRHDAAGDGVIVSVSPPREVAKDEVDRHSPSYRALVERALAILKDATKKSVYPVGVVGVEWGWIDDPTSPALVRLRLSDELGTAAAEFTPQELKDESLTRRRLGRLYGDLLDVRLEKFGERNRESILEHGRS